MVYIFILNIEYIYNSGWGIEELMLNDCVLFFFDVGLIWLFGDFILSNHGQKV